MTELPQRFWDKITVCPSTGCWLWTSAKGPTGYGLFYRGGCQYAHRVAFTALVGPVPEGLQLDHLCRVRNCCNPLHLDPVTSAENSRRGVNRTQKLERTHCINGHEYTPTSFRLSARGARVCRLCQRIYCKRSKSGQ